MREGFRTKVWILWLAIKAWRVLSSVHLEKEMASHPSILAWRIPWAEKPGRLQPWVHGVARVGHGLVIKATTHSPYKLSKLLPPSWSLYGVLWPRFLKRHLPFYLAFELRLYLLGFPGSTSGKEPACQQRGHITDVGSVLGLGRSPGGEHGNPLQYSCLQNLMDRRTWQDTVLRVAKSQTWLEWLHAYSYLAELFEGEWHVILILASSLGSNAVPRTIISMQLNWNLLDLSEMEMMDRNNREIFWPSKK